MSHSIQLAKEYAIQGWKIELHSIKPQRTTYNFDDI